jgi:hypothetical protein
MRALVAVVAVTLVGLALGAQGALAGSKKPGISLSVDLGPASVQVAASSGGADASVDASTPAGTVDATVDSSAQTPVSASVDTSTPVASATVDTADSAAVTVSTPAGSAAVRVDPQKGVEAQVQSPVVAGNAAVPAKPAHVESGTNVSESTGTAAQAALAEASTQGAPAIVASPPRAADVPAPARPAARHRARKPHAAPPAAHLPPARVVPVHARVAARTSSTLANALRGPSRPAAGHAPAAAPRTVATAPAWHWPVSAPGTGGSGGTSGSGVSTAGLFAILTVFLMLVAPIVGRWLRPAVGPAPRPAFASLLERPG